MKVVCINNDNDSYSINHLTVNRIYDAVDGSLSINNQLTTLQVIDDRQEKRFYRMDRFKRLDDIRQDKLNELIC